MANTELMTVSKFAQVVGTTRRTLLFYDQKGIFKPEVTKENGYRYYSYAQIYKINLILSLRSLGLSIEEIKKYLTDSDSTILNTELSSLKEKIKERIINLQQILTMLDHKVRDNTQLTNVDFYTVKRCFLPAREFWCSDFKVDCSEKEIAQAYSNFYQRIGSGVMANEMLSGFLTDLPKAQPNLYADAGFRIIKEKSTADKVDMPVITQPSAEYLIVKVTNTGEKIEKGLAALRKTAKHNKLQLSNDLWQFNLGVNIKRLGLTEDSILAYQIIS